MHVKKGDTVVVITGKDKGKKGAITHAFPRDRKVVVEGVNMVKRSMRARTANTQGQIIEKSLPIDASNVALADGKKKVAKKKTK
jgi:large subunit ribosomal protein L24